MAGGGGGRRKKVATVLKLQIPAGQATPAPPVGPALGQAGINIMEFCKQDRSFSFITKTPPAAVLLRQRAGVDKGSGEPNREKVGTVTKDQVREIAEIKMPDLNANDVEAAMKIVEGTARSMGITVR